MCNTRAHIWNAATWEWKGLFIFGGGVFGVLRFRNLVFRTWVMGCLALFCWTRIHSFAGLEFICTVRTALPFRLLLHDCTPFDDAA